jgi:hypothetical protein
VKGTWKELNIELRSIGLRFSVTMVREGALRSEDAPLQRYPTISG